MSPLQAISIAEKGCVAKSTPQFEGGTSRLTSRLKQHWSLSLCCLRQLAVIFSTMGSWSSSCTWQATKHLCRPRRYAGKPMPRGMRAEHHASLDLTGPVPIRGAHSCNFDLRVRIEAHCVHIPAYKLLKQKTTLIQLLYIGNALIA